MPSSRGTIAQVSVGTPRTLVDLSGREFTSAVRKRAVVGRVAVTPSGLAGDRPADPSHGGPNMAVHAFSADHYPWFEARAGRTIEVPAFGENLTVADVSEGDLRPGDEVRAGSVLFQVTQPTVRCGTPGRGAGLPQLLTWIQESLFTGWYLRVLEPGDVASGDAWEVVRPSASEWTLAHLNHAMMRERSDAALMQRLLASDELTPEWRGSLERRLARDEARRVERSH